MKILALLSILSLCTLIIDAQRIVNGTVYDKNKEPISGAVVKVKNTTIYTKTDSNGRFSLKIPDTSNVLIVSFIGKNTTEINIKNRSSVIVILYEIEPYEHIKEPTLSIEEKIYAEKSHDKTKRLSEVVSGIATDSEYASDERTSSTRTKYNATNIRSGMLTAGELNDFGKWEMWKDISENDLSNYQKKWIIKPSKRYCVLVTDPNNQPIIDASVFLVTSKKQVIWSAKTDNTGKAELWESLYNEEIQEKLFIKVYYQNQEKTINKPDIFQNGINRLTINTNCDIPNIVDIAFVIDATGSMGDEIRYLQTELYDVIQRVDSVHKDINIRMATVFYRDLQDDYVTKAKNFERNISMVIDFIKEQSAYGGGDYPEAVDSALFVALNNLDWSQKARTRLLFLILDAPPHDNTIVKDNLKTLIRLAAEKGVRIIPVVCSGVDKSTEYLMRSIALATNGNYVFLTDDSGIGESHIKPTTDKWEVELFNDLLVRLINQYIFVAPCNQKFVAKSEQISKDTIIVSPKINENIEEKENKQVQNDIKPLNIETLVIYPNPTSGKLTVEVKGDIKEFYICDIGGKILQRQVVNTQNIFTLDISTYPQGFYFVRYFIGERLMSGKIVLSY